MGTTPTRRPKLKIRATSGEAVTDSTPVVETEKTVMTPVPQNTKLILVLLDGNRREFTIDSIELRDGCLVINHPAVKTVTTAARTAHVEAHKQTFYPLSRVAMFDVSSMTASVK